MLITKLACKPPSGEPTYPQSKGKLMLGILNWHRYCSEVLLWHHSSHSFLLRMVGISNTGVYWCLKKVSSKTTVFKHILKTHSYVSVRVNNGDDKNNINNHNLMNTYYWLEIVLRFLCKLSHVIVIATLDSVHFSSFYGWENQGPKYSK